MHPWERHSRQHHPIGSVPSNSGAEVDGLRLLLLLAPPPQLLQPTPTSLQPASKSHCNSSLARTSAAGQVRTGAALHAWRSREPAPQSIRVGSDAAAACAAAALAADADAADTDAAGAFARNAPLSCWCGGRLDL